MIAIAIASAMLFQGFGPMPPFQRLSTARLSNLPDSDFWISGNTLYVGNYQALVAYSLPNLTKRWSAAMPNEELPHGLVDLAGKLYVSVSGTNGKPGPRVLALDAISGKRIWTLSGSGPDSQIGGYGNRLYLGLAKGSFSALDKRTHKTVWSVKLPPAAAAELGDNIRAVYAGPNQVVFNRGDTTFALNAANGSTIWNEKDSYAPPRGFVTFGDRIWIPAGDGSVLRRIPTGAIVWKSPVEPDDYASLYYEKIVCLAHGEVVALNAQNGHEIWSVVVGPKDVSSGGLGISGGFIGSQLFIPGATRSVLLDPDGRELLSQPRDSSISVPIWSSTSKVVCFDGQRAFTYVHGNPVVIPTDHVARSALAKKMLAEYDQLDGQEKDELVQLGDDAFDPTLTLFMETCARFDATKGNDGDMNVSGDYYSKSHELGELLDKITTAKRITELLKALERTGTNSDASAKPELLSLIGKVGDPNVVTPFFIKELEDTKTPSWEMYESNTYVARGYIADSSDPRAVAYMIKALKDPNADPVVREAAYDNLARTGGQDGLKAVLAERRGRALLQPFIKRFAESCKPLATKTDSAGHKWGLLESGILGNHGDLWLAEQVSGQWTDPLFTGVSLGKFSGFVKHPPPAARVSGKTAEELIKSDWLTVLLNDPSIRKRTVPGGFTDLEKIRLGLDINSNDEDGDGDADDIDPWPNAAIRPLDENETVLAAVFEARYHFSDDSSPAIFYAPWDMKPFEMPGRVGPTIWVAKRSADLKLPLERCYERGVIFINMGKGGGTPESAIRWSKDHTEATVEISTYRGGLNGDGYEAKVRKFGDDWVVVSLTMAYVS